MYITTRSLRSVIRAVLVTVVIGTFLCVGSARAALVIIAAPPSVQLGALQSQTAAYLFQESTVTLGAALSVDIATPGLYNIGSPDNVGAIPAGTNVHSYMLHHESVDNKLSTVTVAGSFPNPILGIIVSDAFLDASDPILGNNPGTSYPTGLEYRGLEIPYLLLSDVVFWSGNQVFISVKTTTAAVLDQIRIITAVPEPSTICLALAAAPLALLLRKRRRIGG
jgi:hypothetical protein